MWEEVGVDKPGTDGEDQRQDDRYRCNADVMILACERKTKHNLISTTRASSESPLSDVVNTVLMNQNAYLNGAVESLRRRTTLPKTTSKRHVRRSQNL